MVPIFTYRDERKLFAVVGAVIVAALLALLQLDYARQGRPSPLGISITTVSAYAQIAVAAVANGIRTTISTVGGLPQLAGEAARLRAANAELTAENQRLTEALARVPAERDVALAQMKYPRGVPATVVGYDPEAALHVITIDRGGKDGIARDDGVVTNAGAVGRVIEVSPLTSKVLLLIDVTSRLPAIVQRGRWWSIGVGTQTRVRLQYVSQDAKLKRGDTVVTGEGRSFHAGIVIGRIREVEPAPAGALDQSAIVQPAVDFGSISRVVVLPK